LFQRLVRRLYIAERGFDLQVVDDSGGDRGNDGYDAKNGLLLAIYCPEKPVSADFVRKAKIDLAKAIELRSTKGYSIREWAFVTPVPLRDPAQAELRSMAADGGMVAKFISDEHLEEMYRRFPHLHDDFPELEYPRVGEDVQKILAILQEKAVPESKGLPVDQPIQTGSTQPPSILDGFLSGRLNQIAMRLEDGDPVALAELERFRMEALDSRDVVSALILEMQFYQDRQDHIAAERVAGKGLDLARRSKMAGERAVFAANLAYQKALILAKRDMDLAATAGFSSVAGIPLMPQEQFKSGQDGIENLAKEIDALVSEAQTAAQESGNLIAMFIALVRRGGIITQRHFAFAMSHKLGFSPTAGRAVAAMKQEMEGVYDAAVRAASALGSADRLAIAYGNFANDLVAFDDYERGREHAKHALAVAEKAGNATQANKSRLLLAKIARERPDLK
jgi:hypothetical protein